jgi:predicted DNA-binding transcriptional regulator AlpA
MTNTKHDGGKNGRLVLTAPEVADLLGISIRHLWRMNAKQLLPEPVRMGGTTRWRRTDIQKWVELGCPDRPSFLTQKGGA